MQAERLEQFAAVMGVSIHLPRFRSYSTPFALVSSCGTLAPTCLPFKCVATPLPNVNGNTKHEHDRAEEYRLCSRLTQEGAECLKTPDSTYTILRRLW